MEPIDQERNEPTSVKPTGAPRWVFSQELLLWTLLVAVALGVTAWAILSLYRRPELPVVGSLAEFEFIERSGQHWTNQDLRGRVWIVGCSFSCCTMSCPQMREAFRQLQYELRRSQVLLATISVDPDNDTPEQLQQLAHAEQALPDRWLFFTTDRGREYVRQFLRQSFHSDLIENPSADPGQRISHSSRFYLIDGEGRLRGSYPCVEEILDADGKPSGVFEINAQELARLRADAETLASGPLGSYVRLPTLPTVNAALNGTSAVLLVLGYVLIRRGMFTAHVLCMLGALLVSALFLASYLYYHSYHGATPFPGQGWIRPTYFAILISHTILAVVIVPLIGWTLFLALRGRYDRHRRIARWTLPLWLYVSTTGVVVYVFLYHLYAP